MHQCEFMSATEPPRAQLKQNIAPYLDAAYNLARWLAGNDIDAENIALQACLRALRLAGGLPGANGRSWLLAIVRNTAYAWLRQHRPGAVISVGDEKMSETGNPLVLSDHLSALNDANRDELRAAMESLPVELRETLILQELEGLSYKEIADITEIPIGAVMSRLAHARLGLLGYLDRKGVN
jgi:RNA polymerase sigma-70 factor (ECF subfamily)